MFHVKHCDYRPKQISKTLISAGEIPLILAACAMVFGRTFESFCLASEDRDFIDR